MDNFIWEIQFKLPDGKIDSLKTCYDKYNKDEINVEFDIIEDKTIQYLEQWNDLIEEEKNK